MSPAVFVILVLLSVPGGFRGEITALEPAGERSDIAMGQSVLLQLADLEEAFPTDLADVFLEVVAAVLGG